MMAIEMDEVRAWINETLSSRNRLVANVKDEKFRLATSLRNLRYVERAQVILQSVAKNVQDQAHTRIASIVTECLSTIFGEDAYTFRIIFETKRGKTDAKLVLERDGVTLNNPAKEAGGGVIDVAAFALRLACLILSRPKRRRVLFLDEPFRFVDSFHSVKVGELLSSLSYKLGVQIIVVTHDTSLMIGKVIKL